MSLNIATGSTPSQITVDEQIQRAIDKETLSTPTQVAIELADAYLLYSKEGTLPGADLTVGGNQSLLNSGFITDNTPLTIDSIAEGICNYWSTNNAIGTPAHGGTSVVSVVIDGASATPAMKAAIESIITDVSGDGWTAFYQATQDVVKTIPCIITEIVAGTPTPFEETIV